MVEKEPGWLDKVVGTLFNPGGDPDAIRRAKGAALELSTVLDSGVDRLKPVGAQLGESWEGHAAEAFQEAWKTFTADLDEYAKYLGDAAGSMEKMADFIEEAQRQARVFWATIAASVAMGAVATIFTAGFSTAASAAVVSANLSGLAALAARMAFALSSQAIAMGVIQSAIATVMARMAMGMAFSFASSVLVKGVFQRLNIFDPASWNANDASKFLLDGALVVGMGTVASAPSLAARLTGPTGAPSLARALTGGAIFGAAGSGAFSFVSQFGFGGRSLTDPHAWTEMAASTGIGFVSGIGSAGLFHAMPSLGTTGKPSGLVKIDCPDVMRGFTGSVSDVVNYIINYPQPGKVPQLQSPGADPAAPRLPKGLPPLPEPAASPTLGGGTRTVRRGESLWTIAAQVYGDSSLWPRIAAANPQLANPSQINPGDVIYLPSLQPAHR